MLDATIRYYENFIVSWGSCKNVKIIRWGGNGGIKRKRKGGACPGIASEWGSSMWQRKRIREIWKWYKIRIPDDLNAQTFKFQKI